MQYNFFHFMLARILAKNSISGQIDTLRTYGPRLFVLEGVETFLIAFPNENIKREVLTRARFNRSCTPHYCPTYSSIKPIIPIRSP